MTRRELNYKTSSLLGRLANGFEGGRGVLVHARAVRDADGHPDLSALCGQRAGPRSAGWHDVEGKDVTCPRCKSHLKNRVSRVIYRYK